MRSNVKYICVALTSCCPPTHQDKQQKQAQGWYCLMWRVSPGSRWWWCDVIITNFFQASSGSGHLKSEISRRAFQQWDSTHCMSLVVPWCGGIHTSASAEVWVLAAAPGDPLNTPAWNFLRHGDWSQFSNGHGMHGFTPVHSLTPKNLCWMNSC